MPLRSKSIAFPNWHPRIQICGAASLLKLRVAFANGAATYEFPTASRSFFLGSSSEGLKVTEEFRRLLPARRLISKIWTDGVFEASNTFIESLTTIAADSDFAVLLLTPDDTTISKGRTNVSPRDNLVFELGLFIGATGRERVFILKPKGHDVKIPSDLLGVTWLDYATGGPKSLGARLRPASERVMQAVSNKGPR